MEQELKYTLPPIVLIALFHVVISGYCPSSFISAKTLLIQRQPPFSPTCYIASFKPEAPEIQTHSPIPLHNSASYVTYGTANATASPSPSFEIPEDNIA